MARSKTVKSGAKNPARSNTKKKLVRDMNSAEKEVHYEGLRKVKVEGIQTSREREGVLIR